MLILFINKAIIRLFQNGIRIAFRGSMKYSFLTLILLMTLLISCTKTNAPNNPVTPTGNTATEINANENLSSLSEPESLAVKSFKTIVKTEYQNIRVHTVTNDGTHATIELTVSMRPDPNSPWDDYLATYVLSKTGGTWQVTSAPGALHTVRVTEGSKNAQQAKKEAEMAVSYSKTIKPILDRYCVRCHHPPTISGGVDLSNYVNVKAMVKPGDASQSLLYNAITGNGVSRQPPDASLPAESIKLIFQWITAGAPNN
jgi:hypothetical protein